jgi:DNA polymerase-3 subunit gamma/tau
VLFRSFQILEALLASDIPGLMHIADDMTARSLSADLALQELAALLTRVQVGQFAPQALADDLPERALLLDLAQRMDPEFVQLAYQIAIHGRQELPLAPDDESGLIMTLLRLHAFRPAESSSTSNSSPLSATRHPLRGETEASKAIATAGSKPAAKASHKTSLANKPPETMTGNETPAKIVETAPENPEATTLDLPPPEWRATLSSLKLGGMARELAQHCELREMAGQLITLRLPPAHRHLQMKPAQDKLQQAISEYFGHPIQLRIELAEVEGTTPAAEVQRERRERQDRAVAAIESNGFVREIIEMFDATLIESSIRPV